MALFDKFGRATGYGQMAPGRDSAVPEEPGQPGRPRRQENINSAISGMPVGNQPMTGAQQTIGTQPKPTPQPSAMSSLFGGQQRQSPTGQPLASQAPSAPPAQAPVPPANQQEGWAFSDVLGKQPFAKFNYDPKAYGDYGQFRDQIAGFGEESASNGSLKGIAGKVFSHINRGTTVEEGERALAEAAAKFQEMGLNAKVVNNNSLDFGTGEGAMQVLSNGKWQWFPSDANPGRKAFDQMVNAERGMGQPMPLGIQSAISGANAPGNEPGYAERLRSQILQALQGNPQLSGLVK